MENNHYKVIIIGSGCAGLTAAIYTARANLKPLVIEGSQTGGQLTITTEVENYPGFPQGIQGPQLMADIKSQAGRFGTEFVLGEAAKADLSVRPFSISAGSTEYKADSLIIATGASAKFLGLESEKELMGYGVSACATCDGFFYKGKEVIVAGGGDTAMEEALFLTKFASKVTIVHRRDRLRASKIMQDKVFNNEKIDFRWDSVIIDVLGEKETGVTGIKIRNVKNDEVTEMGCDGVFVAIGHSPNTALFRGQIEMDDVGYIKTSNGAKTGIEGVFAAGDVADTKYRQAVTAAGSGCMAAIDAERYLENLK